MSRCCTAPRAVVLPFPVAPKRQERDVAARLATIEAMARQMQREIHELDRAMKAARQEGAVA